MIKKKFFDEVKTFQLDGGWDCWGDEMLILGGDV